MNWTKVKLGEICQMNSGGTPSRSKSAYYGGNILWAKISDIESAKTGIITETEEKITEEGLKAINNRIFEANTLLLAMYGSVGKTAITGCRLSTNQAILGIRPLKDDTISLQFLKYWLQHKKEELLNRAVGGTLQNISLGIVKNLEIPLPDLATQKHIAEVLDKADALRQQNRQLLAHYDELLQSTFIELFGDPVKNPKGWEVKSLKSVISKIESGWSPVCLDYPREKEDEWAVLKLGAVTYRVFNPNENKKLPPDMKGREDIEVKQNDLLFSRKNTRNLVGATVFVFNTTPKLILPDTVFRLKYNHEVNGLFLLYLFNEKDFKLIIQNLSSGSSGSMPNISKEKLSNLPVPIPPLPLQQHFAKIVEQIEAQKAQAQAALAESEALFDGLLAGYFK